MWFNTTTTQGGYLMGFGSQSHGASTNKDRQVWMSDTGQLNFGIMTGGGPISIQSPSSYNDGQWHQVVATDASDGLNLYVDGQLVNNNTTTSVPQKYLGYWRVGYDDVSGWNGSPTNSRFAGTVSDVAFYNVELSGTQVAMMYAQSGASLPTAPTGVTAKAGTGNATVSWTAPSSSNGSPVTAYVVTPFLSGEAEPPRTYNSTALSEVVDGLTKGQSYTFKVAAQNAGGTSANSVMSNAVSPK
jgi:Concanavalin A-like lectin/glucanases superfamily/Fibronectin type III domain